MTQFTYRKSSMSLNDKRALDVMRNSAKLRSRHYKIALPLKQPDRSRSSLKITKEVSLEGPGVAGEIQGMY